MCLSIELVMELIEGREIAGLQEWMNLTPIQFGVLSWHLGNFYSCLCASDLTYQAPLCFACHSCQSRSADTRSREVCTSAVESHEIACEKQRSAANLARDRGVQQGFSGSSEMGSQVHTSC